MFYLLVIICKYIVNSGNLRLFTSMTNEQWRKEGKERREEIRVDGPHEGVGEGKGLAGGFI